MSMSAEITNNAAQNRYEIHQDGSLAGFAEYRLRDDRVIFTHTEIDPSYEGQGLGGKLARGALDDVRATGRKAVPLCPFIKAYIGKHPEYKDLVAD
ncbi:MAG: family N-acetyltransferase [Actinomycetia bacterium]|jgi:predicted GNAT family acetyltransferase|nr:family N-acetyltransferase [Actinomycetes bacterium]